MKARPDGLDLDLNAKTRPGPARVEMLDLPIQDGGLGYLTLSNRILESTHKESRVSEASRLDPLILSQGYR